MDKDSIAHWEEFAAQARNGELYLDDEAAARACITACDLRLSELSDLMQWAQRARNVSGFGDFDMANDLAGQFLGQATGEDNSIDKIILEHIEVVKDMGEIMALSIKRITGQDVTNTANFNTNTEAMG